MAQKFEHILQSINNSEIRIALEALFAIAGIGPGQSTGSPIEQDIIGNTAGVHTGAVTGDVTGSIDGAIVDGDTLITKTLTPVNAVASEAKLTSSGAMVPAEHAESVLTSSGANAAEDDTVTIGATVYTFKDDPTGIAFAVDVGTDLTTSMANLVKAINLTGTPDTEYGAGTTINPIAWATASDATTMTLQVKIPGDESNAAVTEASDAAFTWTGADFANGTNAGVTSDAATVTIGTRVYTAVDELSETAMTAANAIVDQILYGGDEATLLDNLLVTIDAGATEGTNYSTGTVVNADVESGANTNTTQIISALVAGVIGDTIAIACTWANTAWDAVDFMGTETAGVDGTVGSKGQIEWDASYMYVCILANTTADANWERAGIASY